MLFCFRPIGVQQDEKTKALTEMKSQEDALLQTQKDLAEAIKGQEALRVELNAKEEELQKTLLDMTSKVMNIQKEKEEEVATEFALMLRLDDESRGLEALILLFLCCFCCYCYCCWRFLGGGKKTKQIKRRDDDLAAKAKQVEEQTLKVESLQQALRVAKEQDDASKEMLEDLKQRLAEAKKQTESAEEEVGRHQLQEKKVAEDLAADLSRAKGAIPSDRSIKLQPFFNFFLVLN